MTWATLMLLDHQNTDEGRSGRLVSNARRLDLVNKMNSAQNSATWAVLAILENAVSGESMSSASPPRLGTARPGAQARKPRRLTDTRWWN